MSSGPGSGPNPLLLAGIALVMIVVGWKATEYAPAPVEPADEARQEREARGMSAPRSNRGVQSHPTPPYRGMGRVLVFGGLILFIAAGVLMYRQAPDEPREPREETGEGLEEGPPAGADSQRRAEDGPG